MKRKAAFHFQSKIGKAGNTKIKTEKWKEIFRKNQERS